jgi:cytochrome d ubiquinol oxidase subunit I
MHFFSTVMVALGSIFSSVWIVVANSWQQTPAGSHLVAVERGGAALVRAEITDFWALVFNPSTVQRLVHVWIGAFILGAFFIMSISAWYVLRGRHEAFAHRSFTGALLLGTLASLAALVSGHSQARNVYRHQPAKIAAFEAHFTTGRGDLSLFGVPDEHAGLIRANVAIPGGLSFLLHDDFETPVLGLDRIRPEDRPPVLLPFVSYRAMVGLGIAFIGLTLLASVLHWRRRLFETRWLLWGFVFAVGGAMVANQAGWVAAEVGRQPWVVQPPVVRGPDGSPLLDPDGFVQYATATVTAADGTSREVVAGLRTRDGVSESVTGGQVLTSILLFGFIYLLLGALWIVVLHHKIQAGPEPPSHRQPPDLLDAAGAIARHRVSLTDPREGAA